MRAAAVAVALMVVNVGCATTSQKEFNHSEAEVVTAMLHAQEEALMRLQASPSPDIAEAAREIQRETVR